MGFAKMPIRSLKPSWPQDRGPRHWYRGEVIATQFMNSLSITFPIGEKYFIDSVFFFRDKNQDPSLTESIRAFVGQEGQHLQAHKDFNNYLIRIGLPVDQCQKRQIRLIENWKTHTPPLRWLAATVCFEHLTALIAKDFLERRTQDNQVHTEFAQLWMWHAVEELEHKAVAFDLFRNVGGGYFFRLREMVFVTVSLANILGYNLFALLKTEKHALSFTEWIKGIKYLSSVFFHVLPGYFSFFTPWFHPSKKDDSKTIARALENLDPATVKVRT